MDYAITLKNNNKILHETREHRYEMKCAEDFNIRFALQGNEVYRLGRRELSIHPDSFLIMNKGTQYISKIDSNSPVESLILAFDQKFVNDFDMCYHASATKLLDYPAWDTRIDLNFNETIYPFNGDLRFNIQHLKNNLDKALQDELLINEYLHHCLINYYRVYRTEVTNKAENLGFTNRSTKVEIMKRLNLAKEYMYTNYNQNISLEDLARHSCLSVNHLLRTFKQAFNLSPHQFLIQLRLQRAKLLLKTTPHSINEVVLLVGFECPSSFIRLFKNKFNITPLKFKQMVA